MKTFLTSILCLFLFAFSAEAASVKIIKVLPHFLDQQGRHSVSPSLFERDHYQALLRTEPDKVSTLRFDIQWRNTLLSSENLKLLVEIRSTKKSDEILSFTTALPQRKSIWSKWSHIKIPEETYKEIGGVAAWRVSIIDGDETLQQVPSFMWDLRPDPKLLGKDAPADSQTPSQPAPQAP